jgi:hypothetical protein
MSEIGVLQDVVICVLPWINIRFSMVDLRFPTKKQAGQGICLFVLIFSVYGIYPSLKKLPASSWIQLITGLSSSAVTLLVAGVGYRNYQELQRNNATNYQALIDKNTADRFSKGVEQLGNENIHVRLGGIFALEQIANTEDLYYWQIMEILTAYVRVRSPWPSQSESQESSEESNQAEPLQESKIKPNEDIQAVMTVLGRRKSIHQNVEEAKLDLSGANLQGLRVGYGSNLQNINFERTNLRNANLIHVNLQGARFYCSNLQEVYFWYSNLEGGMFCRADVKDAKFMGANLDNVEFILRYDSTTGIDEPGTNVINLTTSQVRSAKSWSNALFPESIDRELIS